MPFRSEQRWIVILVASLLTVGVLVLSSVLATVFLAITLAYVLYPMRRRLVHRGVPPRIASIGLMILAAGAAIGLMTPPLIVIYQRRETIIVFLRNLPDTFVFDVGVFVYTVDTNALITTIRGELSQLGVKIARNAVILGMKLFLFMFLIYALLVRPGAIRELSTDVIPDRYQDIVTSFHERTRNTLYGIYIVQVATGVVTFLIALPFFFLFGYKAFFTLAVVAGILQLIPIVGPSILIISLGVFDSLTGSPSQALLVVPVGLLLVGAVPDIVLRPHLANRTAGIPASLYFVGFTGGTLTLGPIGLIAGPLIIALILESFNVLRVSLES